MKNRKTAKNKKKQRTSNACTSSGSISFSKADIKEVINSLKCSIGMDGIHSNYLQAGEAVLV